MIKGVASKTIVMIKIPESNLRHFESPNYTLFPSTSTASHPIYFEFPPSDYTKNAGY